MNDEPEATLPADSLARSTGVSNPLILLQSMIERGTDPDALKKMMDLAERWKANQAAEAFQAAKSDAQAEMPSLVRTKKAHTSSYAPFEEVNREIRPIYTKHGFAMSFTEEVGARDGYLRIVCILSHREGHTERYIGDYPLDGEGAKGGKAGMNAIQATGSTHSYAKRYLTKDIWNLAEANEDDDAAGYGQGLSGGQILAINNAIEQITDAEAQATAAGKVLKKSFDFRRFCQWASGDEKADSLDAVPASKFDTAMDFLERRRKEVAK